jgi:ribosomal protein S18 acetylase RimI-like enzyme
MPPLTFREASEKDANFLAKMLWLASEWREDPAPPMPASLAPHLAKYVEGFGRPGDFGVLALRDGVAVGAAWGRLFSSANPGYGYVSDTIPELSIVVRADARGRGVATELLTRLLAQARHRGFSAVSLSVEIDNPARRLYERLGFRQTGVVGGSLTMTVDLPRATWSDDAAGTRAGRGV